MPADYMASDSPSFKYLKTSITFHSFNVARGAACIHSAYRSQAISGNFRKQLHELDNDRLMRMREKLTNFSFEVKWVEGKTHMIADALSRAPVFQPKEEEDKAIDTAIQCLRVRQSNKPADIEEAIDENYNANQIRR